MFKKIWKDPVGSDLISTVIGVTGAFIITFMYSLFTDMNVKDLILKLWNLDIKLGIALVTFSLLLIAFSVIKNVLKPKLSKIERLEILFSEKYNKILYTDLNITCRFTAFIDEYNNYPAIHDLRVYCNKHDPECLLTEYRGCRYQGCNNMPTGYSENAITQQIEAYLLKEWEKMKSSEA